MLVLVSCLTFAVQRLKRCIRRLIYAYKAHISRRTKAQEQVRRSNVAGKALYQRAYADSAAGNAGKALVSRSTDALPARDARW